MKTYNMYGAN